MTYSSLSCDELVRACVDTANAGAWQEFICRFGPVINRAIWRVACRYRDSSVATIEDLVNSTYIKFLDDNCRVLREFKSHYPNAFYGMAGKVAGNVARDHFRRPHPPVIDDDISDLEGFLANPPASDLDRLERRMLVEKIDKVLRAYCSARDREIFWLYYGDMGLTAAEIARISRFNLSEEGVESVLHRLKRLLRRKFSEEEGNGQGPDKAA